MILVWTLCESIVSPLGVRCESFVSPLWVHCESVVTRMWVRLWAWLWVRLWVWLWVHCGSDCESPPTHNLLIAHRAVLSVRSFRQGIRIFKSQDLKIEPRPSFLGKAYPSKKWRKICDFLIDPFVGPILGEEFGGRRAANKLKLLLLMGPFQGIHRVNNAWHHERLATRRQPGIFSGGPP